MSRNLTREEFVEVIDLILTELSGYGVTYGADVVNESLPFRTEVDEALKLLRDRRISRDRVVGIAIGLVDEFVRARWDPLVEELYVTYATRAAAE